MKENEFIELLIETIDTEDEIGIDTLLEEIEEYDSIAVLSLMSMYDELSVKVSPDDFKDLKIEVLQDETDEDKSYILISLADNSLSSIFAVLCEDLISSVAEIENEKDLIKAIHNRLVQWRELFSVAKGGGLSEPRQLGLYGELYLLKKMLLQSPSESYYGILTSWIGPESGIRDFEYKNCAIEVKTGSTNNHQKIQVSSERQLDPSLLKHLFLFHLSVEKRNSNEATLNKIVEEIYSIFEKDKSLSLNSIFKYKLLKAGYFEHHHKTYEDISFIIRTEGIYEVKDDFPRIEEKHLMKGVGDVKYSIVLTSVVDSYLIDIKELMQKF